jgi:hypothetical protein
MVKFALLSFLSLLEVQSRARFLEGPGDELSAATLETAACSCDDETTEPANGFPTGPLGIISYLFSTKTSSDDPLTGSSS